MMINKYIPVTESIENPDKSSINSKDTINISVSNFDISASGYTDVVLLNFQQTETTIFIENFELYLFFRWPKSNHKVKTIVKTNMPANKA